MTVVFYNSLRVLTSNKFSQCFWCSSLPQQAPKNKIAKVVNVAIIGAPNSGKSTLINRIMNRKVCAASNKVHTTTKMTRAICYENDTQIIFLDTPGVVTSKEQQKYKLPDTMISACEKSLRCADVIGVVHDISNRWTKDSLHSDVLCMLNLAQDIPSFLIMNKVDRLQSKKQLLTTITTLTNGVIAGNPVMKAGRRQDLNDTARGYSRFSDVFMVSALNGDGVNDIKEYLVSNAKPANLQYSSDKWTDQTPETLIVEAVRAKFLDFLAQEIPYKLNTQLEYYEELEHENKVICSVVVECPTERIVILIRGAGGGRLQQIKSLVRNDLIDMFQKTVIVDIKLTVKSKPSIE